MEFNISSFCDNEESSSQLNSTALNQNQSQKKEEWKLSPIFNNKSKTSFKSPLKLVNGTTESGYESKSFSTPPQEKATTSLSDLSSFIANKSMNPFDSLIVDSLHKSLNFSPRVVFSQESSSSSSKKDGNMFEWSVEHLAVLKPVHISEDEIAANYHSPIPEVEERIQEVLNEYWSKNVSYIPSPDGPRYINIEKRDGSVLTLKTGGTSSQLVQDVTPNLCNMIRKKEAMKVAYATSSPKQRPRRQTKQMRNRQSQTEVTIPPSSTIDLKQILGEAFTYNADLDEEEDNEEVFNVSMCSNLSTRRRLFSENQRENEEEEEDDGEITNSSMISGENLNDSQRFNDSLSPVRKDEQMEQDLSMVSKSQISQIAINISVLNDCMMHSLSQEDPDEEEDENLEEEEEDEENRVFHQNFPDENEYSLHDESEECSKTPRHEDLDRTPRRYAFCSSSKTPSRRVTPSSSGSGSASQVSRQKMRQFMCEMSPIHPNKRFTPPKPFS